MNKKRLSLYLDNICNLKCSYCNVDYSKKRTFSDQDLLEWFEKNKEIIDMRQIKLCGGEPTLIYLSLFDFLDQFESIFMITNLYDENIIDKWVKRFSNKLDLVVSIHDEVLESQFKNMKLYSKYIRVINLVISQKNLIYIPDILNKIIEIKSDLEINLLPELPNDSTEREVDFNKLDINITHLLKYINEKKITNRLTNMEVVKNIKMNKTECDISKRISIFLDGRITPCVCNSPFFITFKNENSNKKNSKYEDCKLCRKCTLYTCNDGYINDSFDYREFCFLSKRIYDFCEKEMIENE